MFLALTTLLFLVCLFSTIELLNAIIPRSPLKIKPYKFQLSKNLTNSLTIKFQLRISNPKSNKEIMISDLKVNPRILLKKSYSKFFLDTSIKAINQDLPNRNDNYWQACIVKSHDSLTVLVDITLTNQSESFQIQDIDCLWVDINWSNYGPFGRINRIDGFALPLLPNINNTPKASDSNKITLPIKTHILGVLDNPIEVIKRYALDHMNNQDILTIGETPLAIMQGRYVHPNNIKTTLLSRFLCYYFHPTSSLATATGMQVLINSSGPSRVLLSWLFGGFLKLFKLKGFFYRLAGSQARLIDDITGTTPPYDKTIVLGPINTFEFCQKVSTELGIHVAVVDVNDLGRVKVLASSEGCNNQILYSALLDNPAGNGEQSTPLVIVRN